MERHGMCVCDIICCDVGTRLNAGSPQGILNEVWKHKLIFVETPDANETSIALENYRRVGFVGVLYLRTQPHPEPGMR